MAGSISGGYHATWYSSTSIMTNKNMFYELDNGKYYHVMYYRHFKFAELDRQAQALHLAHSAGRIVELVDKIDKARRWKPKRTREIKTIMNRKEWFPDNKNLKVLKKALKDELAYLNGTRKEDKE